MRGARLSLAVVAGAAVVVGMIAGVPGAAFAEEGAGEAAGEYDDDAPDEDFVWEDGDQLEDGTTLDGFYRLRSRPGFVWTPGHYEGGSWVAPDWRPTRPAPRGQVWVPGHRGADGYWIAGQWRPIARKGFVWTPGRLVGGEWVHGHWTPVEARAGQVWVPGHWTPRGQWIEGHWREAARADASWVEGRWRYGRWVPGYWQPRATRAGEVWVPGHWSPRGWVDGFWRPAARPGQHWVAAGWAGGVWKPGRWARGPRPRATRRYHVRPVVVMHRTHQPRLWHAGKVQERRGERMEKRGERTGNERLERRGKAQQRRGERKQKRAR